METLAGIHSKGRVHAHPEILDQDEKG